MSTKDKEEPCCQICGHLSHITEDCRTLTKEVRAPQALPTPDSRKLYQKARGWKRRNSYDD